MDALKGILSQVADFFGGLLGNIGGPSSWPGWVFAGLAVAAIMGGAVYIWNRIGKGMLVVLVLAAILLGIVVLRAVN